MDSKSTISNLFIKHSPIPRINFIVSVACITPIKPGKTPSTPASELSTICPCFGLTGNTVLYVAPFLESNTDTCPTNLKTAPYM